MAEDTPASEGRRASGADLGSTSKSTPSSSIEDIVNIPELKSPRRYYSELTEDTDVPSRTGTLGVPSVASSRTHTRRFTPSQSELSKASTAASSSTSGRTSQGSKFAKKLNNALEAKDLADHPLEKDRRGFAEREIDRVAEMALAQLDLRGGQLIDDDEEETHDERRVPHSGAGGSAVASSGRVFRFGGGYASAPPAPLASKPEPVPRALATLTEALAILHSQGTSPDSLQSEEAEDVELSIMRQREMSIQQAFGDEGRFSAAPTVDADSEEEEDAFPPSRPRLSLFSTGRQHSSPNAEDPFFEQEIYKPVPPQGSQAVEGRPCRSRPAAAEQGVAAALPTHAPQPLAGTSRDTPLQPTSAAAAATPAAPSSTSARITKHGRRFRRTG
eukprot:TRINITY_DN52384_c0_g1_i1.p1 TRINITY_DN52384_c0_g1~~TRINITY_DN52384_c0_g1_i1.p1  ORF type:complete len:388 (-),score=61.13 TRINITY_DN52384_c0_g1_i1:346-1509(-)